MRRIFIETPQDLPSVQYLSSEDEKYLKKVLRLKLSEEIDCFDGKGKLYTGTLTTNQAGNKWGIYITKSSEAKNKEISNTLILSTIKLDRIEIALEKCTEIGIDKIIITNSQYSQIDLNLISKKVTRFQTIIQNACRQSERLFITEFVYCSNLELESYIKENSIKFIATTETDVKSLMETIEKYKSNDLTLWIGPEGGFSSEELKIYNQKGFINVSLGKNILRSETACIVGSYLMCNR